MYLMYDDDGSFIGIVKENPMAETYHDINWFLVEVPDLIFNDDTWEWEFTAPVRVEEKHDQTWNQILQGWVITLPCLRWHPPNKTLVFSSKTFSKPIDKHARLCYNKGVPRGNKKKKRKEENKND